MRRLDSTGRPCSGARRGFTLLEVMVALVVSGIVLVGAHALLASLADGAARITSAALAADREANADRFLRSLFHRLEVGADNSARFGGDERGVRFSTWCDVPAGWLERCSAAVQIDTSAGELALTAVLSTGEVIMVRSGFSRGVLRYIADPSGRGVWFPVWGVGISAPSAVGVILDADTLILRIGQRG